MALPEQPLFNDIIKAIKVLEEAGFIISSNESVKDIRTIKESEYASMSTPRDSTVVFLVVED